LTTRAIPRRQIRPAVALVTAPNQRVVYVSSGTPKAPRLKPVRVKVGVDDGAESEILDGLHEGDTVVTAALSAATQACTARPAAAMSDATDNSEPPPVIFLDAVHKIYKSGEVDVHAVRGRFAVHRQG